MVHRTGNNGDHRADSTCTDCTSMNAWTFVRMCTVLRTPHMAWRTSATIRCPKGCKNPGWKRRGERRNSDWRTRLGNSPSSCLEGQVLRRISVLGCTPSRWLVVRGKWSRCGVGSALDWGPTARYAGFAYVSRSCDYPDGDARG